MITKPDDDEIVADYLQYSLGWSNADAWDLVESVCQGHSNASERLLYADGLKAYALDLIEEDEDA